MVHRQRIVFISHAERDLEALHILEDALRREGIEFYVAEEDPRPGVDLSSKIHEAIRASDVVIALMTQAGTSSPSVNQEVGIALKLNLRVIPLVHQGVNVGVFLDSLEQFRFDNRTLPDICSRVAAYITRLKRTSQDLSDDPYFTRVSSDFTRCRNGAYAFHNSTPANARNLLLTKYDYFVKRPELHYPRFLDNARSKGLNGETILEQLLGRLHKAPEVEREKVLADYITCLYL